MRVRGLKHYDNKSIWSGHASHPMRVRGLKPTISDFIKSIKKVAPHAGAWIETNEPSFAL